MATRNYDAAFGLDMSANEAMARFAKATEEELASDRAPSKGEPVPEGEQDLVLFKKRHVRRVLHDGEWWFSIVDVIAVLTESTRPRRYWYDLKRQIVDKEGFSQLSEKIGQLPMPAADGKMYRTEVATPETILRIVQSVPSPRADPFKRWLAKVGYERIQETQDPALAVKRAIATYQAQGRSDDWIETRIRSIVARKELTNEWQKRGVQKGREYGMLTNVISEETFGMHTKRHSQHKGLGPSHNLRDHMTDLELILTMLGESSTKEIARQRDAQGFYPNHQAAKIGGSIAGGARKRIEAETGTQVVSKQNFLGSRSRTADPEFLTRDGYKGKET